ncbi:MAG: phosphodiester glycosidase family protein [Bacillota bacterium]|nr:phosphodiester glycosidase family protein [Bacillota bacterium]
MAKREKNKDDIKKDKIRRFGWKYIAAFIVFEIIFTSVSITFLIFKGPFENVKSTVVGAAMTSLSHQYIAKMFLSDDEINKILHKDSDNKPAASNQQENVEDIKIQHSNDTKIDRYDISGKKFKGYLLVVHDPSRVKVGYSKKLPKQGERTSKIAEDNNAIAAINGGGFTDQASSGSAKWTGTGGLVTGLLMSNGNVINKDSGDDEKITTMGITNKGLLLVGKYSLNELKKQDVTEAVSFDPVLIVNGVPQKIDKDWGIAPRTAIGQDKDGDILLLVIDGRQASSLGATIEEVQNVLLQYGAVNAINLDGGSSATMYYDGDIVNNPSDATGERLVPSAIYVEQ